jgi:uncharacterized protein YecT (DUF1311 family)
VKKRKVMILALGMAIALAGCGSSGKNAADEGGSSSLFSKIAESQSAEGDTGETSEDSDTEAETATTTSGEADADAVSEGEADAENSDASGAENATDSETGDSADMEEALEDTDERLDNPTPTSDEAKEHNNILGDLLQGKSTLSFDYYKKNLFVFEEYLSYQDELINHIDTEKTYTLTELQDTFQKIIDTEEYYYQKGDVEPFEYSFLDLGMDGELELAIRSVGPYVEAASMLTFIVKVIDNQPQVVYVFPSWSRSYTLINKYGYISGGGSNGASNHAWDAAYLDGEGKYIFGYYEEEESELTSFAYSHKHGDIDFNGKSGVICVYKMAISDDYKQFYYTYDVFNRDTYEQIKIPNLYTDSEYKDIMDSFEDVEFLSMDEFENIKDTHLKEVGLTGRMMNGGYLEYKPVSEYDPSNEVFISFINPADYETIQDELAGAEKMHEAFVSMDWAMMGQQDMNYQTGEWYNVWDDELNLLWKRIIAEIDPEKKDELVSEQRAWIKRKEAAIKAAGKEAEGGSLQPQLENGTAERYTRKRAYQLAEILADLRGENFQIPAAVAEDLADVDVSLDEVFKKFEGQWITNPENGACIGVERSSECDYGVEGSTWTVWETRGDTLSDLNVIDFTDTTITFKLPYDSFDAYYQLRFNIAGNVELAYGQSLDSLNEVSVSQ